MQYPQGQNCCDSNYQNTCYTGCGTQYPIVPGSNPALNYWNGQNFVVADGSSTNPIILPFFEINAGTPSYVLGANNAGKLGYYSVSTQATGYFNILIVAGGGAGGATATFGRGGGGGGGGVIQATLPLVKNNTSSVAVGSGGLAISTIGNNGQNSSFGTFVAIGGGGGGGNGGNGTNGSSGGGGSGIVSGTAGIGGFPTLNQGNFGGSGSIGGQCGSGGGGGAGGVGINGINSISGGGGNGGIGIASTIYDGTIKYYGGGGGGANRSILTPTNVPLGGNGGGGNGFVNTSTIAQSGTPNTGGGGGGNDGTSFVAGNGGSGIVIVSYNSPTQIATGGTVTSYAVNGATFWVHTFTTSGNFIS